MGKLQKILTTSIWAITVVMMIFIVTVGVRLQRKLRASGDLPANAVSGPNAIVGDSSASITQAAQLPMLFDAPQFHLLNEQNHPFGSTDLQGRPYLCQFIFTTCPTMCPMMLAKMARLQQSTDPRLQLISFSVDPDHDRPAVLRAKASSLDADPKRWHFLTNADGDSTSISAVQHGFLQARPGANEPITMHSDKFLLVDGDGHVRGIYSSGNEQDMMKLNRDAALLVSALPVASAGEGVAVQ